MLPISAKNADNYAWGNGCDGWILAPSPDMMVIEEQMPADTEELRHHHDRARQFFYVLSGELTMEVEGSLHRLEKSEGIEIPPGAKHQARNASAGLVRFLVISSPTTRGDRIDEQPVSQVMLLLVTFDLSNADLRKFEAYEEAVLPLLKRHGAGLNWRVRSADTTAEYHLLHFPGHEALSAYRSDPERERLQHDWISCGATATSLQVFNVG